MALKKRLLQASLLPPFKRAKSSCASVEMLNASSTTAQDIEWLYQLGTELGRGQFGVIRACINKQTGESSACKSIAKAKLSAEEDREDVRMEIEILKLLKGHPNIVGLKDVCEDSECIHIIMELCHGGELFHKIVERQSFSEKDAAVVIKSLVEVVKYCHGMGVMHRDLKPENILLSTASPFPPIKLADFGLAVPFIPGQRFSRLVGSAYYMAPELLNGDYSKEVDLWSVGIILYFLLSGVPPFRGDTEEEIFYKIKECKLDFGNAPWHQISTAAKELIEGLLNPDATARLTAEQVLGHPWILHNTFHPQVSDETLKPLLQGIGEEAELYNTISTDRIALHYTFAEFCCRVDSLDEQMILPNPLPLTEWEFRSSLDPMLQQGHKAVSRKPLDHMVVPLSESGFLPYSLSCLSVISPHLLEFCTEPPDILQPLLSRDSLCFSSIPFFQESPLSCSSSRWTTDASLNMLDSSAIPLPSEKPAFREEDGFTYMTAKGIESLDTDVKDLRDLNGRDEHIEWKHLHSINMPVVGDSCLPKFSSYHDKDFSVLRQIGVVF